MSKSTGLILGFITGVAVGVLISPKKVYELKVNAGESYNHFIEENGPLSKEMVVKFIQEKRNSSSSKTKNVDLEEVVENVSEAIDDVAEKEAVEKDTVPETVEK